MKPYIAVIKDSFREALASRVLWILLALIGVFLAALAPFGWKESFAHQISPDDIRRTDEFIERLDRSPLLETNAAVRHVRSLLDDDLFEEQSSNRDRFFQRLRLANELTDAMESDEFFNDKAWADVELEPDTAILRDLGEKRSDEQNLRLNRLALQTLFGRYIRPVRDDTVAFQYAGYDVGLPAVPKKMAQEGVEATLKAAVQLFAGSLGVFVAVLVTASIIPNTFDAGSVYLLLSKPISRPLLYLAKFIGGCSFVMINASILVIGVWLLAGMRLGHWNHRLLYCIPVFLFLFAVYYSVSGFAGLVWRNTIVCIGITALFWAMCFFLGVGKGFVDLLAHEPNRVAMVSSTPDGIFTVANSGAIRMWNEETSSWDDIVERRFMGPAGPMNMRGRSIPPAYDFANQRTILFRDRDQLCVFTKETRQAEVYESMPSSIDATLLEPDGRLLAVGNEIYRIEDELVQHSRVEQPQIFGFKLPKLPKSQTNYELVSIYRSGEEQDTTKRLELLPIDFKEVQVALNQKHAALVILQKDVLSICEKREEGFVETRKTTVNLKDQQTLLGTAGDHIVLALEDGSIRLMGYSDLEEIESFQPFGANAPRYVHTSNDGRYAAVLFHSQEVWLYDLGQSSDLSAELRHQKGISGIGFADSLGTSTFMAVDRIHRVTEYDLSNVRVVSTNSASGSVLEKISWYVLDPLVRICPQPSSLGNTIEYLVSGKKSAEVSEGSLNQAQIKFDPWAPVWSSAAFMLVILAASCIYIYRQDY